MDANFTDSLNSSKIFSSLTDAAKQQLMTKCRLVELRKGEVLFYSGDISACVYLLLTGRLVAEGNYYKNKADVFGYIEAGETVGELGVLTNEPRSLTVRAVVDAKLLKLTAADFLQLCQENVSVLFATLQPVLIRTQNIIQKASTDKAAKHAVILPANQRINLSAFSQKIFQDDFKMPNTIIFSDYQPEFADKMLHGDAIEAIIKKSLSNKSRINHTIYILNGHDTPLARYSFKRSGIVYVVGSGEGAASIDEHVIAKINSRHGHLKEPPQLILLYDHPTSKPHTTTQWLALNDFSFCHHVRSHVRKDYQRLLRFIRGKAVGVVLSGGASRGWAHLGVIKALQEKKIPIDMIGGASAGALIGAGYAINESLDEAYEKFHHIIVNSARSTSWRSLTWPIISIFSGKNYTDAVQTAFADIQIENLWLPFFCVSCNLTKNREDVHTSGLLWEKLRASSALPGILPPMILNGDMHFDGGLLNNLPVDIMRQFIGYRGKLIASELNGFIAQERKFNFPPVLTIKEAILIKLGISKTPYHFPGFIDTFIRAMFLGSDFKATQHSLMANLRISPDLSKYSLIRSNPEQSQELMEIGYETALQDITHHKE